eukprot:214142_1
MECIIESHEISKIYGNHLKKYHSTKKQQPKDCTCLFWNYYSNPYARLMYSPSQDDTDEKESKTPQPPKPDMLSPSMHFTSLTHSPVSPCPEYIIHASFFLQISGNALLDKVSISSNKDCVIKITQSLLYHDVDLNGTQFTFLDRPHALPQLNQIQESHENPDFHDIPLTTPTTHESEYTTFHRIYMGNDVNYKRLPRTSMRYMSSLKYESSEEESCTSNTGMVYCTDFDDYDDADDDGTTFLNDDDDAFTFSKSDTNMHHNPHQKRMKKRASSPTLRIKQMKITAANLRLCQSVVEYDSNKHYVPNVNGYGLKWQSQSEMSTNSQLPSGGKMCAMTTEGSVMCFDD